MASELKPCKCGEPHDNWPGNDGGQLCQMCWEHECDASWWQMVQALDEAVNGNRRSGSSAKSEPPEDGSCRTSPNSD